MMICNRLIDSRVAGVFFTPLEIAGGGAINEKIAEELDKAGIAVVLLDRDLTDSYHRSKFDIIGINNEQSSLILTNHLLELGCKKIDFVSGTAHTTSINDRIIGYRAALEENHIELDDEGVNYFDTAMPYYNRWRWSDSISS